MPTETCLSVGNEAGTSQRPGVAGVVLNSPSIALDRTVVYLRPDLFRKEHRELNPSAARDGRLAGLHDKG